MILFLLRLKRRANSSAPAPHDYTSLENCHGLARASVVRSLRDFLLSYTPSILFLYKIKLTSSPKISCILSSLGFHNSHIVPAIGKSGGLALGWHNNIDLRVIVSNQLLINSLIFSHPPLTPGN